MKEPLSDRKFYMYDKDGKDVKHKGTVLAPLQQCKDRGLTVAESEFVFRVAISCIEASANHSPLSAVLMHSPCKWE